MIVHSRDPLNAETPREELAASPLIPAEPFYVRNHGGARLVVRVDVSIDGGPALDDGGSAGRPGPLGLALMALRRRLRRGAHTIHVRAGDSAGATRPSDPAQLWNPQGYVNTSWGRATVHAG